MKTSISFLNRNASFKKTIEKINECNASFIHIDVMDGIFVPNVTPYDKEMLEVLKNSKKKKEVHLMTLNLKKYIDLFLYINPEMFIIEYEATANFLKVIKYIKEKNKKVGIAINPMTPIKDIISLLKKVDLVLIMSVIPGAGGQKFIPETIEKIKELEEIRRISKLKFLISIDGGVNDIVMHSINGTHLDRVVVGSFVCNSVNFNKQIEKLECINEK